MRGKITLALLACIFSTLITTSVLAEDVYITKYGKKYHKLDSYYTKGREVTKITREEAEEKGLLPSKEFLRNENASKEEVKQEVNKEVK
jgi:hypothetical protein